MVYVGSIVRNRPKKRPSMTSTRRQLFNKHGGRCVYCQRKTQMPSMLPGANHQLTATIDHILPLCRGGTMKGDNITLACQRCNGLKGDMTPHQWAEYMMLNPKWWEGTRFQRKMGREMGRPLPIEHTRYIFEHGKKAYREWVAASSLEKEAPDVCPVMSMVAQFFVELRYGIWRPRTTDQPS